MILSIIAAADEDGVIGLGNTLPWDLPADLQYFRAKTRGHPVIMGRNTFDSIIERRGSILPDRRNIVITRSIKKEGGGASLVQFDDIDIVSSIEGAISLAKSIVDEPSFLSSHKKEKTPEQGEAFIIGGAQIYELAMPFADRIYLTRIHSHFEGDIFFPHISPHEWTIASEEKHIPDQQNTHAYTFLAYEKIR